MEFNLRFLSPYNTVDTYLHTVIILQVLCESELLTNSRRMGMFLWFIFLLNVAIRLRLGLVFFSDASLFLMNMLYKVLWPYMVSVMSISTKHSWIRLEDCTSMLHPSVGLWFLSLACNQVPVWFSLMPHCRHHVFASFSNMKWSLYDPQLELNRNSMKFEMKLYEISFCFHSTAKGVSLRNKIP